MARLILAFAAGVIVTLLAVTPVQGGARNCKPAWKCAPQPTARATVVPTTSPYTFDDEFDTLSPVWTRHYSCCGTIAGFDPALATVSGGLLHLRAERRSNGWYSYLLDTKTTWTHRYGYFEARIRIPKGKGLWPAFWGYYDANDAEIDTMEVCANPVGSPDVTVLNTHVHWSGGGDAGVRNVVGDQSLAFHTYGMDWRPDHVAFFYDGAEVWRFTDAAHIPSVPLPLILNLGVGGSWCGAPDSTTPSPAEMLVDWVHVQ